MKKHGLFKRGLSCCIAFVMIASILSLSMTVLAADPVSFTVTNVSGEAGTDVVVTISISANTNMGCVALNLQYDTTKLTYKSYTLGSAAMSSGPGNYMAQINSTYAVNGNLTTINDSYISDPGIMDGGAMINYKFTIKSGWTGSTPLTLAVKDLFTVDWVPLTSTVSNGSVSIPAQQYNVTFDANGGTGGTGPVLMQSGTPLTAPTVRRPGFAFAGWLPALPETVEGEATYTAQWVKTTVNVTQVDEDTLAVNIEGWAADYSYQIWTYQKITSDLLLNGVNAVQANQWIVSMPYTLGSAGVVQLDGSINFTIANFVSPDENCTIAVRIVDADGNYLAEMRDGYTPTELGLPVITDVLVDGKNAKGRNNAEGIFIGNGHFIKANLYENNFKGPEIREIKPGASVLIKVMGNAACTVYTAKVAETMATIPLTIGETDEFTWDISELEPRTYNLIITAGDGSATDTVYMLFKLYKTSATYGVLSALATGTPATGTPVQTLSVTPGFTGGLFNYWVREEGRAPEFRSAQFASAGGITYDFTKYGTYAVQGYVYRSGIAPLDDYESYDDEAKVFVDIKRGSGTSSVDLAASSNPVAKGTPITLTASNVIIPGIGATPLQYSFWRYDADGYDLLKDWSTDNTLGWTPGRVGDYPIEVRVKGEDAGSYEARADLTVTVTDGTDAKAIVTNVTAVVNGTATARIPVVISAKATASNGADLLYKFNVSDEMTGQRTVQNYSADQELIWTPREAGTYYIDVLVKSSDSFGIYDAMEKITVEVLD